MRGRFRRWPWRRSRRCLGVETTTRKRGELVAPSAIAWVVSQADHLGCHVLWARQGTADGRIGDLQLLAIASTARAGGLKGSQ